MSLLDLDYKISGKIETCCDYDVLTQMEKRLNRLDSLNCEICKHNIYRLVCMISCDFNRSDFLYLKNFNKSNQIIGLAISEKSVNGIYESCKYVDLKSNRFIFEVCFNFSNCDSITFFNSLMKYLSINIVTFFKNPANRLPPEFTRALDFSPHKCNEDVKTFNGYINRCSCDDCQESCFPLIFPARDFKKIRG